MVTKPIPESKFRQFFCKHNKEIFITIYSSIFTNQLLSNYIYPPFSKLGLEHISVEEICIKCGYKSPTLPIWQTP